MKIFPRPRDYDIKFEFWVNAQYFCNVAHIFGEDVDTPSKQKIILQHSGILFIERYFKIADKKQAAGMKPILESFLTNNNPGRDDYVQVMDTVEKMIYESLGEPQKKSQAGYLQSGGSVPAVLIPKPLEDEQPQYSFYLVNRRGRWTDRFFMKLGYDKIMLSRLLIIMIQYIDSQLKKDDRKYFHTIALAYIANKPGSAAKDTEYPKYYEVDDLPIMIDLEGDEVTGYTWSGHAYPPMKAMAEGRQIAKEVYEEAATAYKDYSNKAIDEKQFNAITSKLFGTKFF